MDDVLANFSEFCFSLFITYVGALELLIMLRHWVHWSGRHEKEDDDYDFDARNLLLLKEKLHQLLKTAEERERTANAKVMQDGVIYKDGYRIDPATQTDIENLKAEILNLEAKLKRRSEMKAELERQRKIRDDTKKQLEFAEAELKRRKNEEEQQRKQQQPLEENKLKNLSEAEKHKDIQLKQREAEQQKDGKDLQNEKQGAAEETQKMLAAERDNEAQQRQLDVVETNQTDEVFEDEILQQISKEVEDTELKETEALERERTRKKQLIEENARKFLEAEQEMVEKMSESAQKAEKISKTPLVEEPIISRPKDYNVSAKPTSGGITTTVKTQFGQGSNESFILRSKPLLFPGVSDDASSNEPHSSKQSSFCTQPSDEITTGTEDVTQTTITVATLGTQSSQQERQEPDGEDSNTPLLQYDEETLRSLDGIKHHPLVHEDGSGRRRAFKKRRSSGSSNSSRGSRNSREEELKMFTSLEEEELGSLQSGERDFTPIKYTTEPTLKVKGHHNRRHKRSPAKDGRLPEDSLRSPLEMLGEESTNPWGEVVPEHYKDTEFWRREKAISIDEEEIVLELPTSGMEAESDETNNKINSSSFEEATNEQNEAAMSAISQPSKEAITEMAKTETANGTEASNKSNNDKSNLQTSHQSDENASPARSLGSPRLRRSPRIDEIDQYEERWRESEKVTEKAPTNNTDHTNAPKTPEIHIQPASDVGPWRDEYGLIMQGLSDFYDFQASANPSRSRNNSRNVSPANSEPTTPVLKDVSYSFKQDVDVDLQNMECVTSTTVFDIYDDTGDTLDAGNVIERLKFNVNDDTGKFRNYKAAKNKGEFESEECSIEDMSAFVQSLRNECIRGSRSPLQTRENTDHSLKIEDCRRLRSVSPLPTLENIESSLHTRRLKKIQQNDELFEKLVTKQQLEKADVNIFEVNHDIQSKEENNAEVSSLSVDSERSRSNSASSTTNYRKQCTEVDNDKIISLQVSAFHGGKVLIKEQAPDIVEMNTLKASLYTDCRRSRSRSPLPTTKNMEQSLENRRSKLIQHNDELFEKLGKKQEFNEVEVVGAPEAEREADLKEEMNALITSLRIDRNRSRSRSPLPTTHNIERSIQSRRNKLIQRNVDAAEKHELSVINAEDYEACSEAKIEDTEEIKTLPVSMCLAQRRYNEQDQQKDELFGDIARKSKTEFTSPAIKIEVVGDSNGTLIESMQQDDGFEDKEMGTLVASLRAAYSTRSRSRSKSPFPMSAEKNQKSESYEPTINNTIEERLNKSRTPSRSQSPEDVDFHRLLNLESSLNRTLIKESEDFESILAESQRRLDNEALLKLKIAQEETELWIFNPSELSLGLERSTYIGESLVSSDEYKNWRDEAEHFRRSKSLSPSSCEEKREDNLRQSSARKCCIYENILSKHVTENSSKPNKNDENKNGAKPKAERCCSLNKETTCKCPKCVADSVDISKYVQDMRCEMATFERSRSCSRSPLDERAALEVAGIETEVLKREIQDKLKSFPHPDESNFQNFQDFSRHLNADFLEDRRASDSAMIVQIRNGDDTFDFEPEEYHHYRRFSLNQEQPVEEYPDDFIYVSQIELQIPKGTWVCENCCSESVGSLQDPLVNEDEGSVAIQDIMVHEANEVFLYDEDETDGSDDERQTVVEVDDEIDTDICDFNERGPTDESHHEQSECEEAERAADLYAHREAADWREVSDVNDIIRNNEVHKEEEGVLGSTSTDSDSFAIDKIYDDAIKNRKPSGILREFDSILLEMQKSYENNIKHNELSDKERYTLWAKTRAIERAEFDKSSPKNFPTVSSIESEKFDPEMRYLGDANMTARHSTRLRSRYGYAPVLQNNLTAEELDIDLTYKPKREYNWRKNFKLDEENTKRAEALLETNCILSSDHTNGEYSEQGAYGGNDDDLDERKNNLDCESLILLSRSPDRDEVEKSLTNYTIDKSSNGKKEEATTPKAENPKKRKSKKKLLREQERKLNKDVEDDSDSQMCIGRNSNIQMETDSPKKKSRSRRSSRSSVTTNDDTSSLFSPRSSVDIIDGIFVDDNLTLERSCDLDTNQPLKKKTRKRKKVNESFSKSHDIKEEQEQLETKPIAPETASCNLLATLSPKESVFETPTPKDSTKSAKSRPSNRVKQNKTDTVAETTAVTATNTTSSTRSVSELESFDLLKDANFYPLF